MNEQLNATELNALYNLAKDNDVKIPYHVLDDLELLGYIDEDDQVTDKGWDYLEEHIGDPDSDF